jgi:two-component system, NtrC family, response regulator AlgB
MAMATPLRILIVDDEANIRKTLGMALEIQGHSVVAVSNGRDAVSQATSHLFDLVFLDMRLGTEKGMDFIPELIAASPFIKIVVITAYASVETAVEAMKLGAVDYLPKPFTPEQVGAIVRKVQAAKEAEIKVAALGQSDASPGQEAAIDFDSQSPAMQQALHLGKQVAASDATVLIRGESGTGKSVMARFIHSWSARASKPFGVVSCPSLSPELLESELFGHVRGAFTGAIRDRVGRIAAHAGGTLFLDEIGDLPSQVQPKLLRFLQERAYERVGENITRHADLRIVVATNLNLEDLVKAGRFREDLLYRINTITLDLPPLRQRVDDIVQLAHRFLAFYAQKHHRQFTGFTPEGLAALTQYAWPGNVRELRNGIERATVVCRGDSIGPVELGLLPKSPSQAGSLATQTSAQVGGPVSLEAIEEAHIRHVLASTTSLEEAARILGIDAATLWRRRKKYGLL